MVNTKDIRTLIPDIYSVLEQGHEFSRDFSEDLATAITKRLGAQSKLDALPPTLRLSKLGPRCPKAFWYSIHKPEMAESLPGPAIFKFQYGHILEAMVIALCRAAGHSVEGEQDELELCGVKGHRDLVLDGYTVDVKSCSQLMFERYRSGKIEQDDPFGALCQLDAYVVASGDDPLVLDRSRGYILAVDKTLGKLCLHEHKTREDYIRGRVDYWRRITDSPSPPACECGTIPDGLSGNIKLDTRASYEAFKYVCHPTLRTFLYSTGPRYLTKVVRLPDVPEISSKNRLINS